MDAEDVGSAEDGCGVGGQGGGAARCGGCCGGWGCRGLERLDELAEEALAAEPDEDGAAELMELGEIA